MAFLRANRIAATTCCLLVGASLGLWACGSFSGSDSNANPGDGDGAAPDAAAPIGPADAASATDATPSGDACANAILCDDFERTDLTGNLWTLNPANASATSAHLVDDGKGNRLAETVNTDLDGGNSVYLLHNVVVPGSSFTMKLDLGWQDFGVGDASAGQFLTTCALYFSDPLSDSGATGIAFLTLDAAHGITLVFQSSALATSDGVTVATSIPPQQVPTRVMLTVAVDGTGSATATVTGLSATPITLVSDKTKSHFGQKLRSVLVGDGYIAPGTASGVKLQFDNVVVTSP